MNQKTNEATFVPGEDLEQDHVVDSTLALASTNSLHNEARGSLSVASNKQEVAPVDMATIQTRIGFWNSRGINSKTKRELIKNIDADFILLNEQFTTTKMKEYTIHESKDMNTETHKVNTSIWHKNAITVKRHTDLETNNLIVIQAKELGLWIMCMYMRPRESTVNELLARQVCTAICHITHKYPQDKLLLFEDLNRETDLSEIYFEPWIDRLTSPDIANHYTSNNGTITSSCLTAVYGNCTTDVKLMEESKLLSDHLLMTCSIDTDKEVVKNRATVPNRKTARAIQKMLINDLDWIHLHRNYPSERSRRTSTSITDRAENIKKDRLEKLVNQLKRYTADELDTLLTEDWNRMKTNTISKIKTNKNLKQTWRTLRNLMDHHKNQSIVNSIVDSGGDIIKGHKLDEILINKYFETTCAGETTPERTSWPQAINVTTQEIIDAMNRVPLGKALTKDCIPDGLFKMCCPKHIAEGCRLDGADRGPARAVGLRGAGTGREARGRESQSALYRGRRKNQQTRGFQKLLQLL